MITPADLMAKVVTKADIAVVTLAGGAGVLLDGGLDVVNFMEPGVVSTTASTMAFGVKNGWEAVWGWKRRRGRHARAKTDAENAATFLESKGAQAGAVRLRRTLELHEKGFADDAQLAAVTTEVLAEYAA